MIASLATSQIENKNPEVGRPTGTTK